MLAASCRAAEMMRTAPRLLILVALAPLRSWVLAQAPVQSAPLSVCQVLSDPLRYDGALISIEGRARGSNEGTWLVSEDCPGVFVTNGRPWPTEIYLSRPDSPRSLRLHDVSFSFDMGSKKKADRKYNHLLRKGAAESCLAFSYTGVFETRRDWSRAKNVYADGSWKYVGFGHLGAAPAQLLTKSEDDVRVIPGCNVLRPKPKD